MCLLSFDFGVPVSDTICVGLRDQKDRQVGNNGGKACFFVAVQDTIRCGRMEKTQWRGSHTDG